MINLGSVEEMIIGQGMGHFVYGYVHIITGIGKAVQEMVPGYMNTARDHMPYVKFPGTLVFVGIWHDINIPEIKEAVFPESEGELNGGGTDQYGCRLLRLHVHKVKALGIPEMPGPPDEPPFFPIGKEMVVGNEFRDQFSVLKKCLQQHLLLRCGSRCGLLFPAEQPADDLIEQMRHVPGKYMTR